MAREHPREGVERLTGREMPAGKDNHDEADDKKAKRGRDDSLARALRTVYDDTLREDIPDEFKDLLGKLG